MSRLSLLILVACIALAAAKCTGKIKKDPNAVHVTFDRHSKSRACGEIEFGPCGRPKSNVNYDRSSTGKTNINGNAFQALETAGRLSEIAKIVGNRYKPEVECPPRPPSNVDTSAESICAQRTVRRKPGKPTGRRRSRNNGGSGSGSGCGSGSGSYDDNVSASNNGASSYDDGVYGDGNNGDSYDAGYDSGSNGNDYNGYDVEDDVFEGDDNGYSFGHGGAGAKRHHHKKHHRHCGCRH